MSNDMRRDFQPALYWRCVEALSFSLGSKCAGGITPSELALADTTVATIRVDRTAFVAFS